MSDWIDTIEVHASSGTVEVDLDFERCTGSYCCGECGRKEMKLTPDEAREMARCLVKAASWTEENPHERLNEESLRTELGLKQKWDRS